MDDVNGVQGGGSVSILYGSASRLTSSGNQLFSQLSPGIVGTAQSGDWYGHSLTAADFNGDGVQDLAVGIPFENIGSQVDAGAVNLIYGMISIGLSVNANRLLHQDSTGIDDQSESGDEFGGRLLPQLYKSPWPDQPLNDGGGSDGDGDDGDDGGGPLSGTVAIAPSSVNLTGEGIIDWVHWGRIDAALVDRKAGVTPQIGNYTPIADANPSRSTAMVSAYSWNDGTPTPVVSNSRTGLWVFKVGKGFEFSVPADTTLRTLKVYVGAKDARGLFEAKLSDGSSPDYTAVIDQPVGKTSRVVNINYQAASNGQVLTIRYTVNTLYQPDFKSWIALESSALQGTGVVLNQPPIITSIPTQTVTEGQTLTIPVSVTDPDGPAPLTLSETNTLPGNPDILTDLGNGSGQINWAPVVGDASGSPYSVTVTAVDGDGATSSETFSISVLPLGGGGGSTLTGTSAIAASNVNLTSEGAVDWAHWGRVDASTVDRKTGVSPKISNYIKIGAANPSPTTRVNSAYSWNDGTPLGTISGTKSGLWLFRVGKGFEFTVPADTTSRILKVFVGVKDARGLFEASLSDGSSPAYSTFINQPDGTSSHVVTLNYQAASSGQKLTVRYTIDTLYLPNFRSWMSLESAALQ